MKPKPNSLDDYKQVDTDAQSDTSANTEEILSLLP